jgi:hypothetical protein
MKTGRLRFLSRFPLPSSVLPAHLTIPMRWIAPLPCPKLFCPVTARRYENLRETVAIKADCH